MMITAGTDCAVEGDGLADHRPVGIEALLPQAIAEEHDALTAGAILIGREVAPEDRVQPQRRQERRRGVKPDHLLRSPRPVHVNPFPAENARSLNTC